VPIDLLYLLVALAGLWVLCRLTLALHRVADRLHAADTTASTLVPVLTRVADGLEKEADAIQEAVINAVVLESDDDEEGEAYAP
jgi:hypothetical protein